MSLIKKIGLFGAAFAAAFTLLGMSTFAEVEYTEATDYPDALPKATIEQMTDTELDAFFSDWTEANATSGAQYKAVYEALKAYYTKSSQFGYKNNVYGMRFTANDKEIDDSNNKYAGYHADFDLTASEDTAVILVGNYGDYGTVVLPVQELTANEPIRVMESVHNLWGAISYSQIVNTVGTFECVAVPVTEELIAAMGENASTFLGGYASTPAKAETSLTLQLKLYEMDNVKISDTVSSWLETGVYWNIGNSATFTYHGTVDGQLLAVTGMPTETDGDGNTYYPVYIYAALDSLKYREVGFEVAASCGSTSENMTVSTDKVYNSVKVGEAAITAANLGGRYMFGGKLLFKADGGWTNETVIKAVPYVTYSDGTTVKFTKNSAEIKSTEGAPLFVTESEGN